MTASAPLMIDARRVDAATLSHVASLLRAGNLAVIPTDTVYGLAAHPSLPLAVEKLIAVKGRDARKPIPLLIADVPDAEAYGAEFSPLARRLAKRFWPGALTLVLPVHTASGGTEGFRVPDSPLTRTVLRNAGGVLRVSSANRSGEPPACTATEAASALGNDVAVILDDGPPALGVPSTVVRVVGAELAILREGAISAAELEAAATAA
ncbi:MAG: L-threonylcarbamoyladenylate synthase [Verrucomicrobia bacterium]|nr:L-threonylcarbamoyladenylate synthase [Verrucomicrobiota bacterium]